MSFFDVFSHRYTLSGLSDGRITSSHEGMHLLARPKVGSRMAMYGLKSGKRIVTSKVVRIYNQPGVEGTFIETGNSTYLLQLERVAAPLQLIEFHSAELSV